MDVQVFGISVDSPAANKVFAEQLGLTYALLSDFKRTASKDYGVLNEEQGFANRTTFVVDKQGVIRHIDKGNDSIDPSGAGQACGLLEHKKQ